MRHDQFHVHLLENDNHPSVTNHYSSCDFNSGLVGTPICLLVEFLCFILQRVYNSQLNQQSLFGRVAEKSSPPMMRTISSLLGIFTPYTAKSIELSIVTPLHQNGQLDPTELILSIKTVQKLIPLGTKIPQ